MSTGDNYNSLNPPLPKVVRADPFECSGRLSQKYVLRDYVQILKHKEEMRAEIGLVDAGPTIYFRNPSKYLVPEDLYRWQIRLRGPDRTPFEHATFRINMAIPRDYPTSPPKQFFLEKPIYHFNVTEMGAIVDSRLDKIARDWNPEMHTLGDVVRQVREILFGDFLKSGRGFAPTKGTVHGDEELFQQFKQNRPEFDKDAEDHTMFWYLTEEQKKGLRRIRKSRAEKEAAQLERDRKRAELEKEAKENARRAQPAREEAQRQREAAEAAAREASEDGVHHAESESSIPSIEASASRESTVQSWEPVDDLGADADPEVPTVPMVPAI